MGEVLRRSGAALERREIRSRSLDLYRASLAVAELSQLGREFFRAVRHRDLTAWPQWLDSAKSTGLRQFVAGLLKDRQALEAALTLPWSNGRAGNKYIGSS